MLANILSILMGKCVYIYISLCVCLCLKIGEQNRTCLGYIMGIEWDAWDITIDPMGLSGIKQTDLKFKPVFSKTGVL